MTWNEETLSISAGNGAVLEERGDKPMAKIRYKCGYKYQLYTDYSIRVPIRPEIDIETTFISLGIDGLLTIRKGYAWDGPSGPAVDTKTFMRGSLVHDALYELMRLKWLDAKVCKPIADSAMRNICRQDGMWRARAWWVHKGVNWFGGRSTRRERKIHEAP